MKDLDLAEVALRSAPERRTMKPTLIHGFGSKQWRLDADDMRACQNRPLPFHVRETPDWKLHAAELEFEMLQRGINFEFIDWSKGQASAGGVKRAMPH